MTTEAAFWSIIHDIDRADMPVTVHEGGALGKQQFEHYAKTTNNPTNIVMKDCRIHVQHHNCGYTTFFAYDRETHNIRYKYTRKEAVS